MNAVLACDLGGTNLRMAAISHEGEIVYRTHRPTPRAESATEIFSLICEAAKECRRGVPDGAKLTGIGAAVPATVNFDQGTMLKAPNVPALDGFEMRSALEREFGLPAVLENDANAAAIGENWLGASKGIDNSVTVTLGTGVGGGIMLGGKLLRGVDGTAAEVGHICVEPKGVRCGCGSQGCVEQYASATAIVRLWNEFRSNGVLLDVSVDPELSSLQIFEAARNSDPTALKVFETMGFYLGIAFADLVNILNPEAIIVGGGLSNAWEHFIEAVKTEIRNRSFKEPADRVQVIPAVLGDDAGLLGVTKLLVERFEKTNVRGCV
jgi:glucokinase